MNRLGEDMLLSIADFLAMKDCVHLSLTCKDFYGALDQNQIWRTHYLRHFKTFGKGGTRSAPKRFFKDWKARFGMRIKRELIVKYKAKLRRQSEIQALIRQARVSQL